MHLEAHPVPVLAWLKPLKLTLSLSIADTSFRRMRVIAHDALRHRIGLSYEAEAANMTSDEIISKIINQVEVP